MPNKPDYKFNMDIKFNPLELIDIPTIIEECDDVWFNQTLCKVNDCVVRLGILEGEFHWHKHDDEDEYFIVLDGELLIDLEDDITHSLKKHQGFSVPKGILHKTRAPKKVVVIMIEGAGVIPSGD